jgi:hypothetical protein
LTVTQVACSTNVASSGPPNSVIAWPGSKMKGIPAEANWLACAIMPSLPSGAQTPIVMLPSVGTCWRQECVIAPG